MISGDSPVTVGAVAATVGVPGADAPVDGRTLPDDLDELAEAYDGKVKIEIRPGDRGIATIWDKDVLIYLTSIVNDRLDYPEGADFVTPEQMQAYAPEVIESFRALVATGCVELLAETYYHSLVALEDEAEFREQVALHGQLVSTLFDVTPSVFRNTELIYDDAGTLMTASLLDYLPPSVSEIPPIEIEHLMQLLFEREIAESKKLTRRAKQGAGESGVWMEVTPSGFARVPLRGSTAPGHVGSTPSVCRVLMALTSSWLMRFFINALVSDKGPGKTTHYPV